MHPSPPRRTVSPVPCPRVPAPGFHSRIHDRAIVYTSIVPGHAESVKGSRVDPGPLQKRLTDATGPCEYRAVSRAGVDGFVIHLPVGLTESIRALIGALDSLPLRRP